MFGTTSAHSNQQHKQDQQDSIRVATFNVSMDATNYLNNSQQKASGDELKHALLSGHQQVKNIAEIIQKINPDIILLNEFDRVSENSQELKLFINRYLQQSQNGQAAVSYPYFYQGPVNTGVVAPVDLNGNGKPSETPADTYGFGLFPGHYGMALLSKFPIDTQKIRTFQKFKWKDMADALKPINPETNKSHYSKQAWDIFRLSSKSHWDITVMVNDKPLHILAAHPTPPVFDGPEDRNGKRNHDEIRLLTDYISKGKADYLYDDNNIKGGIKDSHPFVILGDLNASAVEGDAINRSIAALLAHEKVNDPLPSSEGGALNSESNQFAPYHTAYWRMRADYVLPSSFGIELLDAGVFWPKDTEQDFRLIKDRAASSDHRLVWIDIKLK